MISCFPGESRTKIKKEVREREGEREKERENERRERKIEITHYKKMFTKYIYVTEILFSPFLLLSSIVFAYFFTIILLNN